MNSSDWPEHWRESIGHEMPSSYCAVDLETTGFSKDYDVIVEYGHCLVENDEVVDRLNLVLDWTKHPIIPEDWLAGQLESVRRRMADRGMTYHMTMERLTTEGIDPIKGLRFIYNFLTTLRANEAFFTTHNGYRFDEDMLAHNFCGFEICTTRFSFGDYSLFDTEAIEKSRVAPLDPKTKVRSDDTLRSWCRRLSYANFGRVKTNLVHCAEKYALKEKYGVDMANAHTAGFDSYLTHLLFKEQRANQPAPSTPVPSPVVVTPKAVSPAPTQSQFLFEPGAPRRRRGQRNR